MADTDPVVPDLRTMQIIERHIRQQMGQVKNRLLQEVFDAPQPRSEQWVPFINDSTAAVPPNAIMAILSPSTRDPELGTDYLHCTQASTTFTDLYAVNSPTSVPAGEGGLCALHGPVDVLYDSTSGTPAVRDGYGPQPGKWGVVKGMPQTCKVLGSVDTTASVFHGTLHPITTIIGKTTGAMAATTASTGWRLYGGTQGSETDIGVAPFPVVSRSTIASNVWIKVTLVNNGGEAEKLACS